MRSGGRVRYVPADHVYCLIAQMDIIGYSEMILPVNDFLVRLVGRLGAKWWVTDQAFEHDCAERPPVALVTVPLLQEDFWCDVIWRSDGRIGLQSRWIFFS